MTRLPLGLHGEEEARELCTQTAATERRQVGGTPGNSLNPVQLGLITFPQTNQQGQGAPGSRGVESGAQLQKE